MKQKKFDIFRIFCFFDEGKLVPMSVRKGDTVLFTKYGPNEVKVDGKEYLIAEEKDRSENIIDRGLFDKIIRDKE